MINVICVKQGTRYDYEYVNRLRNMVKRHLSFKHQFVCFTDDAEGIHPNVGIIDLPSYPEMTGWWAKPYIFCPDYFSSGDINLYFDLDMVIINSIDHFINYRPEKFVGLQDLGRIFRKNWVKLGSAVMRWPAKTNAKIWTEFKADRAAIARKFHGDQDWIWHIAKEDIHFFPEQWIQSYKWQIRNRNELVKTVSGLKFTSVKNPKPPPDTSVLAFHGTPDITDIRDPIIVNNWQ